MNKDITAAGYITPNEFRFYLNHWGLKITDKQF